MIVPRIKNHQFSNIKYQQNNDLINDLSSFVTTKTSSKLFDSYIQMNFLDNILRGGFPVNLNQVQPSDPSKNNLNLNNTNNLNEYEKEKESPKIFHTFSRIHGDLERDYNNFQFEPTYFSQGPGNFRDIAQNRRSDVLQVNFLSFSFSY